MILFLDIIIDLLLIFIEFLLKTIYSLSNGTLNVLGLILQHFIHVNMIETSKKRKRTNKHNQTVTTRGIINANWQNFLSSNLIMDKKTEKQDNREVYTGTFRRARKKQCKVETTTTVQNNLKSLNITEPLDEVQKPVTSVNNEEKPKKNKLTKFIAMDCEMVGIGYDGNDHMLARISLVNKFGDCIYDKFVKAREEVIDYRTSISGIRREDLLNGEDFEKVQKEVAEILKGRVLVGHSLKNDLSVLFLSHPKRNIRDTARYKPFRKITKGSTPSLKRLAKEVLGLEIQHGEHSSIEDARAAMQLYCTVSKNWEASMNQKRGYNRNILED